MPKITVSVLLCTLACCTAALSVNSHGNTHYEADSLSSCIVINEINYNSADNFNPEDWLEFVNNTDSLIDISGWIFKDEEDIHHFVFPENTTLDPGEFIVICRDTVLFKTYFPGIVNVMGNFEFGLSGGGELVRLFDQYATLIDSVTYNDAGAWPPEPNGMGPTLELIDPDLPNHLAENWRSSIAPHGTPGSINGNASSVEHSQNPSPIEFNLFPPFPNPFNHSVAISFKLQATWN